MCDWVCWENDRPTTLQDLNNTILPLANKAFTAYLLSPSIKPMLFLLTTNETTSVPTAEQVKFLQVYKKSVPVG